MAEDTNNFEVCHPDYVRLNTRWKMARDFLKGGISVIQPDWMPTKVRIPLFHGDQYAGGTEASGDGVTGTDPELPSKRSTYTWGSAWHSSYLNKHPRETTDEFEERAIRVVHYPLFQGIVNVYAAGVFRTAPKRERPTEDAFWPEYHADVDLMGTNIDAFMREALALSMAFGRVHAITDRPRFEDGATSRGEQQGRGERAYSCLLTPLDLVDWSLDEVGRWRWAVIREPVPDGRKPGQPPRQETSQFDWRYQYRVWFPDRWELWQVWVSDDTDNAAADRFELVAEGPNPVGEVPISTLWTSRESKGHTLAVETPFADALDVDHEVLNRYSELDELERAATWDLLVIPQGESGGAPGGLDVGPFRAYLNDRDAAMPAYVGPNPNHAVQKWLRIKERLNTIRVAYGTSRGMAEQSREERSAEAIVAESEDKRNNLALFASAAEEFDRDLHRHAARWEGLDEWPAAEYPRNFDLKGINTAINELVSLGSTKVLPKEAMAAMARPIAVKMLAEYGIGDDEKKKVLDMIEAEGNREPEPVAVVEDEPDEPEDGEE